MLPSPDELEELAPLDEVWLWLLVAAVAVWPWNECSAITEIRPAAPTAPAIVHRLILEIS